MNSTQVLLLAGALEDFTALARAVAREAESERAASSGPTDSCQVSDLQARFGTRFGSLVVAFVLPSESVATFAMDLVGALRFAHKGAVLPAIAMFAEALGKMIAAPQKLRIKASAAPENAGQADS